MFANKKIAHPEPDPVCITDELARVEGWRIECLLDAGFESADAITLAQIEGEEWRKAIALVERGCDPELATEIFK